MGGLTSRAVNEPKTIAEAKAEITELLTKIKDHYEAINRMRLADRNKWKDFNKTVEELEVVKARALKEEKKRQRDLEREQERRLLEERFPLAAAPEGKSKEKTKGSQEKTKGSREGPQQLSAQPSTETKKSTKTEEAVVIVTSQFPYNMPLEDLDKTQATVAEDSAVSRGSRSQPKSKQKPVTQPKNPSKAPQHEDVFVHIDMPISEPRKCSYGSDTGLHRAKVVTLPIVSDNSDSQQSDSNRSPFHKDLNYDRSSPQDAASKDKRSKSASKTKELLQSVDMSDIKQRYY